MLPVLTVIVGMLTLWYVFAVVLNAPWARDQAARQGMSLGPPALVRGDDDARSGRGCRRRTRWRRSCGRRR